MSRYQVPDYLRLADEALAKWRAEKAAVKEPPGDDAPTLNSHNSLFSRTPPLSSPHSPYLYIKNKNINHINDRRIRDGDGRRKDKNPPCEIREISETRCFQCAFDHLLTGPPHGVDNRRWVRAITDAEAFLTTWGEQANAFGWSEEELFGLHPAAPLRRHDVMGLIWSLQGCPVVALTELTAAIKMPTGSELTFYRKGVKFSWTRRS